MIGRAFGALAWVVILSSVSPSAMAQGSAPTVQVQVERSTVAQGEPFWVRVTVSSEGGATVSLPPGAPFEILGRGSTSTSVRMSSDFNGRMQVQHQESFRLQLRASRQGRLRIGPMVVQSGGREYRAGTATVQVVAPGAAPPAPQQPQPTQPMLPFPNFPSSTMGGFPVPQPAQKSIPSQPGQLPGQVTTEELSGAVFDNELFLRTVIEPEEAYVGQLMIMTVYLYTTMRPSNVNVNREASTDGFWSEDLLGPLNRLSFQDQFVGNLRFQVAQLRKVALFPLREGTLTVGPPSVEASQGIRSIFVRRTPTIAREGVPVQVKVRPLPREGRPDGFHAGNVGTFELNGLLDKRSCKVGEPVTLTLLVRGQGHLSNVKLEPFEDLEGAKVYEPRVQDAVLTQGTKGEVIGERRWEILLLPQKEGRLEIPEVALDYFDPVEGQYKVAKSPTLSVEVSGGEPLANGAGTPSAVDDVVETASSRGGDVEMGHLRSIRRRAALGSVSRPTYGEWWFFVILLAAPLGLIALVVVQRVREHRAATEGVTRARKAAQVAVKALTELEKEPGGDGLAGVTKVMNGFFVDRFGQSATGQTMDELREFLSLRGASEALSRKLVDVMERCEMGRFGGGAESAAKLAAEARELVGELDKLRDEPEEAS